MLKLKTMYLKGNEPYIEIGFHTRPSEQIVIVFFVLFVWNYILYLQHLWEYQSNSLNIEFVFAKILFTVFTVKKYSDNIRIMPVNHLFLFKSRENLSIFFIISACIKININ